jgi:hypothetical protein
VVKIYTGIRNLFALRRFSSVKKAAGSMTTAGVLLQHASYARRAIIGFEKKLAIKWVFTYQKRSTSNPIAQPIAPSQFLSEPARAIPDRSR